MGLNLLYSPHHLKSLPIPIYTHEGVWSSVPRVFEDFKVDKIVDIFVQLTVNKLLGRLVNALANRFYGAEYRK